MTKPVSFKKWLQEHQRQNSLAYIYAPVEVQIAELERIYRL
jgi:hypothetical protein